MNTTIDSGGGGGTDQQAISLGTQGETMLIFAGQVTGDVEKDTTYNYGGPADPKDVVEGNVFKGSLGSSTDTFLYTGEVTQILGTVPPENMRVLIDGEEVDISTVNYEQVSEEELDSRFSERDLTGGGLLAILPGIGPLSSTQTTIAAGVLVLAIVGTKLR